MPDATNRSSSLMPYMAAGGGILLVAAIILLIIIPKAKAAGAEGVRREYQHKANLGDPASIRFIKSQGGAL